MSEANVALSECFRVEYDREDPFGLRRQVKRKLEAQYRQWQDHDQHLWREAIKSPRTIDILGIDRCTLERLRGYTDHHPMHLAILSDLQLCTIPPSIIESYEHGTQTNVTQWLHDQYRRYAIHIHDFGDQYQEYYIPLLDFSVVPADETLFFKQRTHKDASDLLPQYRNSCRLIIFPQTRFSFVEDKIFQYLFPLHDEQFKIMSYNLLPYFRGTSGYYNSFASPSTSLFSQRSFTGKDFTYLAAMYPVIGFEFLDQYKSRKMSEKDTAAMQQHGHNGLPTIAQARYSRRFDFPEEVSLHAGDSYGDRPERLQSGRALYEFTYGEVDTMALDEGQVSVLEGRDRNASGSSRILVVEPLWTLAFPVQDVLYVFQNETGESVRSQTYKDLLHEKSDSRRCWARTWIQVIEKADKCMYGYEPAYRTRLAKLRIQVQTARPIDQLLVRGLSDFVAEVTILMEPLQNQIDILKNWRQYVEEISSEKEAVLEMYDKAIKARETHRGLFLKLLDQGNNTQALLFQLSNTETAYQQAELAKRMAHETEVQTNLAKRAQRQNQSILIFTIITVIFLPLSFFTSYFGMNTRGIRDTNTSQWFFWAIAAPISFSIISFASFWAFRHSIEHWYRSWRRIGQDQEELSEYKQA